MYYAGISWNPNDLISSKNAVKMLQNEGIDEETILQLDFGNLDVVAVLAE